MRSHNTRAISEKPEIGLAAGGGGMAAGAADGTDDADGDDDIALGDAVAADAGAVDALLCARLAFRLLANWFMIWVAVAWIMPTPRPYWATEPDSARSVWTSTLDPAPAGSNRNEDVACAPPRPLESLPCAFTRAL